jgi:phosphotransferase system HPr (HPr) family protein
MEKAPSYTTEVTITNKFGFHVRPIQRFAELARAFDSEIEVQIADRKAPGKSIINLMTLKGYCGSRMRITTKGTDAKQALCVLNFLAANNFFVEEDPLKHKHPLRHVRRLARMASCFRSQVKVGRDGKTVDAKNAQALKALSFSPADSLSVEATGEDSEQAGKVLDKLVSYHFYVEEALQAAQERKDGG